VDVSNDLNWWSDLLDNDWLSCEDLSALVRQLNNMLPLAGELSSWLDILTFFWLQQRLNEHLTQSIIWILVDLGMILLLRVQFLWFLCKLVNGNLPNYQGKIFGSRVTHLGSLDL